jgi:hypothetical protein
MSAHDDQAAQSPQDNAPPEAETPNAEQAEVYVIVHRGRAIKITRTEFGMRVEFIRDDVPPRAA